MALVTSPLRWASRRARSSGVTTWPTTETKPTAPTESSGRLSMSSPEYQARPERAMAQLARPRSPLASLLATIRGCSASRTMRLGVDRDTAAAGDVVEHHRQVGGVRDGREVPEEALLRGLAVVRRHREQAVGAGVLGGAGQLDAVAGVVGAGSGDDMGPVADRIDHGAYQLGFLRVAGGRGLSGGAVDDRPSLPASTRWAASRWAPSRSRAPSAVNGVTMAVSTRPKGVCGVEVGAMGPTLLVAHRAVCASGEQGMWSSGTACSGVQAVPGPFVQPR